MHKYYNTKEFTKRSFDSKRNDLIEFKGKLKLFYHDTLEIKPNNKDNQKHLEKMKICVCYSLRIIG